MKGDAIIIARRAWSSIKLYSFSYRFVCRPRPIFFFFFLSPSSSSPRWREPEIPQSLRRELARARARALPNEILRSPSGAEPTQSVRQQMFHTAP